MKTAYLSIILLLLASLSFAEEKNQPETVNLVCDFEPVELSGQTGVNRLRGMLN